MRNLILCLVLFACTMGKSQEWVQQNKVGYLYPTEIDVYDSNFTPIDVIAEYDLIPVQIISKSKKSYKIQEYSVCKKSHFFKIKQNGKVKIVFGENLYIPAEVYEVDELTLLVLEEKSGDDKTLDCFKNKLLAIQDKDGVNLLIEDEEEYEEPYYLNLENHNAAIDRIENFTKAGESYQIFVLREGKDGYGKFNIQLNHKPEGWFAKTSEYRRISSNVSAINTKFKEIEDIAVTKYKQIIANSDSSALLSYVNDFAEYLKTALIDKPELLEYPFDQLSNQPGMYITTSKDGNLRYYTWDQHNDGSMGYFDGVYQIRSSRLPITHNINYGEGDPGYYVSKIHRISTKNAMYYVVIANEIYSNKDIVQTAIAYKLNHQEKDLVPIDLFKTKKKSYQQIPVQYDFFTAMDTHPERPIEVITYNEDSRTFYFALIGENGKLTKKNLVYAWDPEREVFNYKGVK